jgi:hypothetical protein
VRSYATPQVVRRNPFTGGEEYVLWRIDADALRAYIARLG